MICSLLVRKCSGGSCGAIIGRLRVNGMLDNIFLMLRRYGFFGMVRLVRDTVFSRIFFPGVRLIRYPWYVRGGAYIRFGKDFTSGVGLRVDAFGVNDVQVIFGNNVQVGDYVHVAAVQSVVVEDNVLIASKVYISDHDHGSYGGVPLSQSRPDEVQVDRELASAPVVIGRNVWVGENVCILKGVTIGRNSIIGASAVVTRSVPENCIVVGSPARIIKYYDFERSCWVDFKSSC